MVLCLLYLLAILLVTNFVIGFLRGIWAEGFKKEKFIKGFTTYLLIFIGFAAIDLFAYYAGREIKGFTYLAGILIDPIARYLVKILDTLRELLDFVFGKKAPSDKTIPVVVSAPATPSQTVTVAADGTVQVKRKRGRPRKYPLPGEVAVGVPASAATPAPADAASPAPVVTEDNSEKAEGENEA